MKKTRSKNCTFQPVIIDPVKSPHVYISIWHVGYLDFTVLASFSKYSHVRKKCRSEHPSDQYNPFDNILEELLRPNLQSIVVLHKRFYFLLDLIYIQFINCV